MKVDTDNVPEEYRSLVKDDMTYGEISTLGSVIIKDKMQRLKNKLFGWYYERKKKSKG